MCGIFGYFGSKSKTLDRSTLERMGNSLRHRGPDHLGLHTWENGAIGNQRLSIIDVALGNQPFYSEDKKIAVVQNGEIFNFIELMQELKSKGVRFHTHSDTEVILKLYEYYGPDFVSRLNGMFAIAIRDENSKTLHLYRDRLGVKPLYACGDSNFFVFASEIKALFEAGVEKKPNFNALWNFLSFNYVPPPQTAFEKIEHIPPGQHWSITDAGVKKSVWWEIPRTSTDVASEKRVIEEFQSLLTDSVKIRMRADVAVGAFLSGGLDSSTIVSLMRKHEPGEIQTFTAGFDEPDFDESELAAIVAKKFNTNHRSTRLTVDLMKRWPQVTYYNDQPHGDISFLPTLAVSELAAKHVRVVLTGDGGDELFAGYDKYVDFFKQNDANSNFMPKYFERSSLFTHDEKLRLMNPNFLKKSGTESTSEFCKPIFDKIKGLDPVNQTLYFDTTFLLPGNNLVKPDRMGMACSLEARTPFLDYRLVEFAFGLPGALKLKNGETKYIMKQAILPWIGQDVVDRKKRMFTVPMSRWLKEGFSEELKSIIFSDELKSREIFNTAELERIYQEHESGKANHIRKLRAAAAVEIWFRKFFT